MRNFIIRLGSNAVALAVATGLVSGVRFNTVGKPWTTTIVTVVLVSLIFGVVNAVLKPVARFLSFPAIVLTLGLFTFVVNAFMLQITAWISKPLGLSFTIDHFFWDAVLAAVIVTIVSWLLGILLPEDDD